MTDKRIELVDSLTGDTVDVDTRDGRLHFEGDDKKEPCNNGEWMFHLEEKCARKLYRYIASYLSDCKMLREPMGITRYPDGTVEYNIRCDMKDPYRLAKLEFKDNMYQATKEVSDTITLYGFGDSPHEAIWYLEDALFEERCGGWWLNQAEEDE